MNKIDKYFTVIPKWLKKLFMSLKKKIKVIHVTCGWVFHFLTEAYNFTILIFFLFSFTSLDKQFLNTLNWPVLRVVA